MEDAAAVNASFDPSLVHVVVTPRERYTGTPAALGAILDSIPAGVRVSMVRGGLPRRIERQIEALAGERVQIVGPSRHLSPNAARAIGLRSVDTRYVVFIDNDVIPRAGWLEALVDTAETEDAWVVRPLVLEARPGAVTIHEAGGDCHLEADGDSVAVNETHYGNGQQLTDLPTLKTAPVEMFEFHTVLFDRSRLVSVGGMDQRMLSVAEHLDLALRIHDEGGSVWLEPSAEVVYVVPYRLPLSDLTFFLGRWSPSWTTQTHRAFQAAHGVSDGDPYGTWGYPGVHRSYAWLPIGRATARLTGISTPHRLAYGFDRVIGRFLADVALRLDPRWRGGGTE